jgi:hypothetical protein
MSINEKEYLPFLGKGGILWKGKKEVEKWAEY